MKQTIFKRILPAFLALVMVLGTLSPMANVNAADVTEVTVDEIISTEWTGSAWAIHLSIAETLEGIGGWTQFFGMSSSLDGAPVEHTLENVDATSLYLMVASGQNVTGKTLTIEGTAVTSDESKGITLSKKVTLIGTAEGWELQQEAEPIDITVDEVISAEWTGSAWAIHLGIAETLEGIGDWTQFFGMSSSLDSAPVEHTLENVNATSLYLMVASGQNVTGKTLTIEGTAVTSDESKGIKLTEKVTLVGTAEGWELQQTVDAVDVTVDELVSAVWTEGTWYIDLGITQTLEGIGDWTAFFGMTCSTGNGPMDHYLENSSNGKLFFSIPMDQNVTGKTLTIEGTAVTSDESKGIKLTEKVTLVGTAEGWTLQQEGAVTDITISAVEFSAWNNVIEPNQWNIYLKLTEALEGIGAEDWVPLTGLTYSYGEATNQALVVYAGVGTTDQLCIVPAPDVVPQNVEVGTKLTINAGQALTDDESMGIKLAGAVTLVKTAEGWNVQETNATDVEVSAVEFSAWNDVTEPNQWNIYLKLTKALEGIGAEDWVPLTGLTYSYGEATNQALVVYAGVGTTDQLCIVPAPGAVPQNAATGTKLTINAGKALTDDESVGVKLAKAVVLVKTDGGWALEGTQLPDFPSVEISAVDFSAWNSATEPKQWNIYLQLKKELQGVPADAWLALEGLTYSYGSNKNKALTVYAGVDAKDKLCIVPAPSIVPENVATGATLTINAGVASSGDIGVKLAKAVTLVKSDTGWVLEGTVIKPVDYTKASAESVNSATSYVGNMWHVYLNMKGHFSKIKFDEGFEGFTYSINDGEKKPLTNCSWQAHDDGTFWIGLSDIPRNITKNTKITISGKGYGAWIDNTVGIELSKDIVLYANESGWSLKGYLAPVTYVKASAKSINYVTGFNNDFKQWHVYLEMNGDFSKMPYDSMFTGFDYSIDGGEKMPLENCSWQAHDDGTFFFAFDESVLPKKITKNTMITVSGKGRTTDGSGRGVQLTKDIVLYANQYGIDLKGYKKAPKFTDITVTSVNYATSFSDTDGVWYVYLHTDNKMPGEVDRYFEGLVLEINGKTYDVTTQHAMHEGTLCFPIDKALLGKNAANGTKVTLKAGKGIQQVAGIGINLKKDVTLYKFYDTLTLKKPTTNTKYTDVTFNGLVGAIGFIEDADAWCMEFAPLQKIPGEEGSGFYYLDAVLNGKSMKLKGSKSGENVLISIPSSVLSKNTKTSTLTIKAGSEAVGGHGDIGIRVKEDCTVYLFNGMWSDEKFDEMKEVELFCTRLFNFAEQKERTDLYFYVNGEFPGKAWYNVFSIPVLVNGKKVNASMYKADSSAGKILYVGLPKTGGKIQEGTKVTIQAGTVAISGGYKITLTKDFHILYTDGMWVEDRETDVKAPKAQNLWDVARFDKGYIPVSADGTVMMSGEQEYNSIISTERLMDVTVAFSGKKLYDDAESSSFSLVLRGTPISEDDPISINVLNGYVITFEGYECTEETDPNNPDLWGTRACYIYIWKNGFNLSLKDQYCIGTYQNVSDNPYFKYNEAYDYEVSVYNISETVACIELKVNGELVYKCYDEAGADPADPAINPGIFGIYGVAPTIYGGETVELETVIAEKTECMIGDEVGVAVTYPSILAGAEFTVDKKGAMIENGKFYATEAGTYTVSAKYNGKALKPIKITVKERAVEADDDAQGSILSPLVIVLIVVGVVVVGAGVATAVVMTNKKKKRNSEG